MYGSTNAGLDYGSRSYWTAHIRKASTANSSFIQVSLDDMAVCNLIGSYLDRLEDGCQPTVAAATAKSTPPRSAT